MRNTKTGRNDPCPCGSGKKFKHCCLGRGHNPARELNRELESLAAGREFDSLEDFQAFADRFMQQRNQTPVDDFCGLSPDQMSGLLYSPLDSPNLVRFPDVLPRAPQAPAMTLFNIVADAIGEEGLKITAKGNLPRRVCVAAADALRDEDDEGHTGLRISWPNLEDDFPELSVVRRVAQFAGLIRKYRGRFLLTRRCRDLMDKSGPAGVYPPLLRAYATKFNWAWADGYPELPFIQHSFAFALYLLSRFGGEERPNAFYEDAYLRAFPALLDEAEPRPYTTAEDQVRQCFTIRVLVRFAWFMGLVMMPRDTSGEPPFTTWRVRKTALLDDAAVFSIPQAAPSTTRH